jgi:hypothetical protein
MFDRLNRRGDQGENEYLMNINELIIELELIYGVIKPLANIGGVEEYALAAAERMMLDKIEKAKESKLSEYEICSKASLLLQTFIIISESSGIPLSDETECFLRQAKAAGISFLESYPRPNSRPLSAAPSGPPSYSIFVDESGTASFEEIIQPVLCLVGIIIKDERIPAFEQEVNRLLDKNRLSKELEFHAREFLAAFPNNPYLKAFPVEKRYALLRDYLALGMEYSRGVHHLSMIKILVNPELKQKFLKKSINAYTYQIGYFLITMDRACLLISVGSEYKYYYDRTDAYEKHIGRIFRSLESNNNQRLRLFNLQYFPIAVDSKDSRVIQLADVAGYYLNRYRQFEVPKNKPRPELEKHKDKIYEMYEIIRPKIVSFIKQDLPITVDWKALEEFSLNKKLPALKMPGGRR